MSTHLYILNPGKEEQDFCHGKIGPDVSRRSTHEMHLANLTCQHILTSQEVTKKLQSGIQDSHYQALSGWSYRCVSSDLLFFLFTGT